MKKTIYWIGIAVLIIGIVLFGYAYTTIQSISETPIWHMDSLRDPQVESQWNLAQTLRPIGLGLVVLGTIMLFFDFFVKK
jgi:uncharacterized protein YjeT (DUF2065 family)